MTPLAADIFVVTLVALLAGLPVLAHWANSAESSLAEDVELEPVEVP